MSTTTHPSHGSRNDARPSRPPTRGRRLLGVLIAGALVATAISIPAMAAQAADPVLLSQGKTVTASSVENADYYPAKYAVDGSTTSRWSSLASDAQWLRIDLGSTSTISKVVLNWEGAYGSGYQIQTSPTGTGDWTTIYSTTTGKGGIETLHGQRHRPLRPAARHQARHRLRLLAVRVPGLRHRRRDDDPAADRRDLQRPTTSRRARPRPRRAIEGGNTAALAVDGNAGTRFASSFADNQTWQVDLGSEPEPLQRHDQLGGRVRQGVRRPRLRHRHRHVHARSPRSPTAPAAPSRSRSPARRATSSWT